jgi:hypothetical protein
MAQTEMQVTQEEARFLRRFFRRQALPWMLALGVVAVFAARWAVPAADPGLELRVAESQALMEAIRVENAALRTELDAVGQRIQAAVDRRIGAAEGRIAAVEKRPVSRASDSSGVSARVARLEERLASAATAQDTVTRSNLSRLKDLEARLLNIEGPGAMVPAAPAP